jgi:hypothetical protein
MERTEHLSLLLLIACELCSGESVHQKNIVSSAFIDEGYFGDIIGHFGSMSVLLWVPLQSERIFLKFGFPFGLLLKASGPGLAQIDYSGLQRSSRVSLFRSLKMFTLSGPSK